MATDPFTATLLGSAVLNVGCGLLTNFMDRGGQSGMGNLRLWWAKGKTPANHDVLRATHQAYVCAMREMAVAVADHSFTAEERAAAKALTRLCDEPRFSRFRWNGEHLPLDDTMARFDALYDRQTREGAQAGWRAYNDLIVYDLGNWGIALSERQAALFIEGIDGRGPWHLCFREHFSDMIKADSKRPEGERAFRILTFEALAELKRAGADIRTGIEQIIEDLAEDRRDRQAFQAEMLAFVRSQQSGASDITDQAILGAIARFVAIKPDASPNEIVVAIENFERDYRALLDRVGQIEIIDNRVAALKADAETALRDGNLEAARRHYGEAIAAAGERAIEPVRNLAALIDADASAALVSLDWSDADEGWTRAEAALSPFDRAAADKIAWQATEKLLDHGKIFAARGALDAAIRRADAMCQRLRIGKDTSAYAAWLVWLANSLQTQGQRTGGDEGLALLVRAVVAYEEAITIYTRATTPTQWATAQNNLANALSLRGERTEGAEGLTLLARAVGVYEEVFTVHTRAAMPAKWSGTQNNLAIALQTQGQRTGGAEGLALLARAVAAYEDALAIHTRAEMPTQWAMTQNNLANALQTQGQRTGGAEGLALLARAVAASEEALTVRTRAAMPADWAGTKENIAIALLARADRVDHPLADLRLAEAAVRDALTVYTPEHMPYDYGTATKLLAKIRARIAALDE